MSIELPQDREIKRLRQEIQNLKLQKRSLIHLVEDMIGENSLERRTAIENYLKLMRE